MKRRNWILILVVMLVIVQGISIAAAQEKVSITSPNEQVKVNFILKDGVPYYEVSYGEKKLIKPSSLGFKLKEKPDLEGEFKVIETATREYNDTWEPIWGQHSRIRNHYRELTVYLKETKAPQRKMNLVFRVYDDGIGFRYVLPEQKKLTKVHIMSEVTEFSLAADNQAWWIANDWDSYEKDYRQTLSSEMRIASTPVTMKTPDGIYLSFHEAALVNYAGMALDRIEKKGNIFISKLAPWPDGVKVKAKTPLKTPWRTLQIAADAGDLIESSLLLNLNEPNALENTEWIKPMKYVGIWWAMHIDKATWGQGPNHGATTENAKRYIDFAHQHLDSENQNIGLLVESWNIGWNGSWMANGDRFNFTKSYPDFDLEEVVHYAKERGVEYIMHNETSGDIKNYESQMEEAYDYYQKLGIHAIKSGYVADNGIINPAGQPHHGQYMVNHYLKAVKKAAEHEIMINTHEPIKPTGLYRTYPNWVTREGVKGMEYNAWSGGNFPSHTTILPFTRMLAGPIDYTPGIFDLQFEEYKMFNQVDTTRAKQLALYPVIFSPMQMVADLPENYTDEEGNMLPEFKFIKDVPSSWDETKVLKAQIGDYVSIARRKGTEWYLGTITDEEERKLKLSLDFLAPGEKYVAEIYQDAPETDLGDNPTAVEIKKVIVDGEDTLTASLASSGGQAVRLFPAGKEEIKNIPNYDELEEKRK